MSEHFRLVYIFGYLALGVCVVGGVYAASDDGMNLNKEIRQMEQSNIDAALNLSKEDADKTVGLVAALMISCRDNLHFFVPKRRGSEEDLSDDNPYGKL